MSTSVGLGVAPEISTVSPAGVAPGVGVVLTPSPKSKLIPGIISLF
jgi:hypothetical protein